MIDSEGIKLAGCDLVAMRGRPEFCPEVSTLIAKSAGPSEALAALERHGFLMAAACLLAHALPKREATWWACMCVGHTASRDLAGAPRAALASAEQWVRQQSDAPRRAAFAAAKEAGFASPEAWVGLAAFWSGESPFPAAQPPAWPSDHLTGTAVMGALALAAIRSRPERRQGRLARFLESGHNIAAGGSGRLSPEEG
ncbi:MAG TPA: hypothetical protein VMA37_19295 [Acetobacteraceae bacterium]|nr:hypothetical protein [Acetobacteraceae bacterium]